MTPPDARTQAEILNSLKDILFQLAPSCGYSLSATTKAALEAGSAALRHHDALVAALHGLIGLTQLVCTRDDMPLEIKKALLCSHRVNEAYAVLQSLEGKPPDGQ